MATERFSTTSSDTGNQPYLTTRKRRTTAPIKIRTIRMAKVRGCMALTCAVSNLLPGVNLSDAWQGRNRASGGQEKPAPADGPDLYQLPFHVRQARPGPHPPEPNQTERSHEAERPNAEIRSVILHLIPEEQALGQANEQIQDGHAHPDARPGR